MLTQGTHGKDNPRAAPVILLQVTKAKHMVSKKAAAPCEEKKRKSCRVDRVDKEMRTKLEALQWQIINAFSLRNCKQAEKKV